MSTAVKLLSLLMLGGCACINAVGQDTEQPPVGAYQIQLIEGCTLQKMESRSVASVICEDGRTGYVISSGL